MKIDKVLKNGELLLSIEGRLDTNTYVDLEKELKDMENVKTLVFDLGKLEYISSAGLRILLSCQKKMDTRGKMIVRNVKEEIRKIFDMTGFTDLFTIE